jgi:hypothetical protein
MANSGFLHSSETTASLGHPAIPIFDPRRVAHLEKENWVAYYNKQWLRLLFVSVGMVRASYGMGWIKSSYAAYLVARAEVAAAPFPNNNIPLAEAYMQRFYTLLQRSFHSDLNIAQLAHLEVQWWVVHRKLSGQADHQELVDALMDLYAATLSVPKERVRDAAFHRTQAMIYSDQWVSAGRPGSSPLLDQEEEELFQAYSALRALVA